MASIVDRRPVDDIYTTRKQKDSKDYLQGMINYWIGKLVYEKKHIPICRRYYSGRREEAEFEFLTDNYGIGNPVDLTFTPIIKPRIDALVGLFIQESFDYSVSVTDEKTIELEGEMKKSYAIKEVESLINSKLQEVRNYLKSQGDKYGLAKPAEKFNKHELDKIKEYLEEDFVSIYAEAAVHLIKYFEQSSELNFSRKSSELLYDLLITGELNWRTYIREKGADPVLDVIKPENIFFNKNKNDMYMDSVDAVVHREFYTRHRILQEFGHLLTADDKKKLFGRKPSAYGTSRRIADPMRMEDPFYDDDDNTYANQFFGNEFDTVEVFHVEWLASNEIGKTSDGKKKYIEDRYEGYRIGYDIYFGLKKSDNVVRRQNNKYKASLSYSGITYNLRQGDTYSMVWNLKDVQDMYDITQFHRNNLVATAGVAGTRVNIAGIPKVLGSQFMERLMKWVALRKQGVELIDPTEEGAQLFNHYGEFQGGIDGNAINGIASILTTLERQVVLTTGVTDQMLGQIEEREAVENVKTGIRQVSLITLNIFDLMNDVKKRILLNLIDLSKISYTKGKVGSYKVGPASIAFKIDKDNFSWTDYNIQVVNSSRDALKLQKLENMVSELASAGALPPELALQIAMVDTIFEAKKLIRKALSGSKGNGEQMQQMDGQIQQYEQQLKEAGQQAEKLQRENDSYMAKGLELDKARFELDKEVKLREVAVKENKQEDEAKFNSETIRTKKEIVQLEREQLYVADSNGDVNNNIKEINNSKV